MYKTDVPVKFTFGGPTNLNTFYRTQPSKTGKDDADKLNQKRSCWILCPRTKFLSIRWRVLAMSPGHPSGRSPSGADALATAAHGHGPSRASRPDADDPVPK